MSGRTTGAPVPASVQPIVVPAYSVPVFDDPGQWLVPDPAQREAPYATLVLDAEDHMRAALLNQGVEDLLAGVAQLVGEYVRARTRPRPARAPARPEDPGSGWQPVNQDGGCLVSVRKLRDPSDQPGTLDVVASIESALTV